MNTVISLKEVARERSIKGANKAMEMLKGHRPSNYYELNKEMEFVAKLDHLNLIVKFMKASA